jgi:hypothetical protein
MFLQAILLQTKCFKCTCLRCKDPSEFGAALSAIKCKNKADKCQGLAIPKNPLDLESDLECNLCKQIITSQMAQMMVGTAMKFTSDGHGQSNKPQDALDAMTNLERFVPVSNHIIVDLKIRLIDQVIEDDTERPAFEETAINFCFELLHLARTVAPGHSKLRGMIYLFYSNSVCCYENMSFSATGLISMKYHQLTERGSNPLVISKDQIDSMFAEDQSVLLLD